MMARIFTRDGARIGAPTGIAASTPWSVRPHEVTYRRGLIYAAFDLWTAISWRRSSCLTWARGGACALGSPTGVPPSDAAAPSFVGATFPAIGSTACG